MKYFFDTEFIEDGKTIDLISIGIVAEDGREYYACNLDCDLSKASDWVKQNVLPKLPEKDLGLMDATPTFFRPSNSPILPFDEIAHRYSPWQRKAAIRADVAFFVGCEQPDPFDFKYVLPKSVEKPEFWAYYADYDWVVFCQLFGTMMDLPKGFPMYAKDLKQTIDELGNPRLPNQKKNEHNALADARWVKDSYLWLKQNYRHPAL